MSNIARATEDARENDKIDYNLQNRLLSVELIYEKQRIIIQIYQNESIRSLTNRIRKIFNF